MFRVYDVRVWPFSWAVFDVSTDVILPKPVAETKKTMLVVTSAVRSPPRGMLARLTFCARKHISHPTPYDAFGPAGADRLGPDRRGGSFLSSLVVLATKPGWSSTRNEINENKFWR